MLDVISVLMILVGLGFSHSSISEAKLEESEGRATDIMNLPQLWLKEWYKPERYWVLFINRIGYIGAATFSMTLYFLMTYIGD